MLFHGFFIEDSHGGIDRMKSPRAIFSKDWNFAPHRAKQGCRIARGANHQSVAGEGGIRRDGLLQRTVERWALRHARHAPRGVSNEAHNHEARSIA